MATKKLNNNVAKWLIVILLFLVLLAGVAIITRYNAYNAGAGDLTAYTKVIEELQTRLKEANGYSEELLITINAQQQELAELKKTNKNLAAQISNLEQQLQKAKDDYLKSYEENYNKGYNDGYQYGIAVGQGEIDNYIKNYIAENNGILQKSFKEVQVLNTKVEYRKFEDRDGVYTFSNILYYVEDFSTYSLIVANATGYESYTCSNLTTRLDERTRREGSTKINYTAYIHTFTFINSKNETVEIVVNYDPEFDNEAALVLGIGTMNVACNYFDITTTLSSLENGLTNFYIIQAQPEQ